jgi:hypothetical protein
VSSINQKPKVYISAVKVSIEVSTIYEVVNE